MTYSSREYEHGETNWFRRVRTWSGANSILNWQLGIEWRWFVMKLLCVTACIAFGLKAVEVVNSSPTEPRNSSNNLEWESRANIVDRNGLVLATNVMTNSLFAQPNEMSNDTSRRRVANKLATLFPELDATILYRELADGRKFMWIRRQISPEQMQKVHELGEPGLQMGSHEARVYPQGRLAAHILGGIQYNKHSVQSAEMKGNAGVELSYDEFLRNRDASGELELSIDTKVQAVLRERLSGGISVYGANWGSAVLMDVDTGEVVAMVSLPDFDPNFRGDYFNQGGEQRDRLFNRPVQGLYEFGSVFKVFAAAQAIDLGLVGLETKISNRDFRIRSNTIRGAENRGPELTVREVIARSSNAGTARLALMVNQHAATNNTPSQRDFLASLGLQEISSIELTEARGVKPQWPSRWQDIETVTIAYGHGMAVSQVHLAAAYASLVNGGFQVMPTILKGQNNELNRVRVISEESSEAVVEMLRNVVLEGTARQAQKTTGYSVGGKTGTANKPIKGGYSEDKVLATFASVFPVEDPRYVLVVTLDEATSEDGTKWERSAGKTAVPLAGIIISEVAPLLGLRPRTPDEAEN